MTTSESYRRPGARRHLSRGASMGGRKVFGKSLTCLRRDIGNMGDIQVDVERNAALGLSSTQLQGTDPPQTGVDECAERAREG
jgi:hypothetical protein